MAESFLVAVGAGAEPGSKVTQLVAVMDRLRSPGGCPWDAKQTHESLVEYLIEESYETVEAIDAGDNAALREELGDLLLQVVFHARIAAEDAQTPFDIDDVANGITAKLIARHPHVFGDETAETAEDVESQWDARKAAEKGRSSVTEGVPAAMPAMVQARKLLGRARRGGVAVELSSSPVVAATASGLVAALPTSEGQRQVELGELLLAIVGAATVAGLDADAALRSAVADLRLRIQAQESN